MLFPIEFDYSSIDGLSNELKSNYRFLRPETLFQQCGPDWIGNDSICANTATIHILNVTAERSQHNDSIKMAMFHVKT